MFQNDFGQGDWYLFLSSLSSFPFPHPLPFFPISDLFSANWPQKLNKWKTNKKHSKLHKFLDCFYFNSFAWNLWKLFFKYIWSCLKHSDIGACLEYPLVLLKLLLQLLRFFCYKGGTKVFSWITKHSVKSPGISSVSNSMSLKITLYL